MLYVVYDLDILLLWLFLYRHSIGKVLLLKSECFSCGVEYSAKDQVIQLQERKKLDEYIRNWGKRHQAVPRDGHCILNAFILGLKELEIDSTTEELVPRIKKEVMDNIDFYLPFVGDIDLVAELDDYLESKIYNCSLVDLMLHVLANVTKMSLLVFYTHMSSVHNLLIPPKEGPSRHLVHMAKLGQHYDAILDVNTNNSKNQIQTACKYRVLWFL